MLSQAATDYTSSDADFISCITKTAGIDINSQVQASTLLTASLITYLSGVSFLSYFIFCLYGLHV